MTKYFRSVALSASLLVVLLGVFVTAPNSHVVEARLSLNVPTTARGGAALKVPEFKTSADIEKKLKNAKEKAAASAAKVKAAKSKALKQSTNSDGSTLSFPTSAVAGAVVMAGIEQAVKKIFVSKGITFPAQLASCLILLAALLVSGSVGQSVYEWLTPGTHLLTKWLPVFFVPGLAMLPLAPSVGSGVEVAKVLLVVGLGFIYSLFSVAFSVLFLRAADGKVATSNAATAKKMEKKGKSILAKVKSGTGTATPKAYSDATMGLLSHTTIISGIATLILPKLDMLPEDSSVLKLIQTFYYLSATCATYVWGARLPASFTSAVHPLITSTVLTCALLAGHGAVSGVDFMDMLKSYKVGGSINIDSGAGDILLYLLGPSVVSFAISMYSRKQLLADNILIVIASMLVSSVGGLFGTAAFARLIQLGGLTETGLIIRLSVLARNVTTALGLPITAALGGDLAIAAVVIVLTGIVGAQYGRRLLDAAGITDPVTRGLAVGCSGQGLGVSSMIPEEDAFPFAAIGMTLTAMSATTLVSIPAVKDLLVKICS
eukprot:CAMPEP_0113452170 /NCGR_PEP_ID=MMETSP0014_2-20120614/6711_1 /TAXON_ID=2857 /ORGANISM="Nitzschia sp." /LENGTH=545 /DNA_ID=CAMNT_0000343539 /DNA_START=178 /DNA_END=1815 /DNA_ORIENTATION=- /assembly_acc=CAM_ASM_000159